MPTVNNRNNGRIGRLAVAAAFTGGAMLIHVANSSIGDFTVPQPGGFAALQTIPTVKQPVASACSANAYTKAHDPA